MAAEFEQELDLGGGKRVLLDRARPDDVLRIRWLYHTIYGGNYPFPLVYNPQECAKAIESDRYLWLLARDGDKAVGSVIFTVDRAILLGKVFGAVVAEEFRGLDLAERMLAFGIDILVDTMKAARSVYATTRTVSLGPQRLAEKAGFKKLGIFPNAHKVHRSETHTLAVYYAEGALKRRHTVPRLPLALKPFFALVRRETGLPEAEYVDLPIEWDSPDVPMTAFETVQAPKFVLRRYQELRETRKLAFDFFPFQDPNLLLVSPDGGTEVFVYRSSKDGHCVLTGARSDALGLRVMLYHSATFLEGLGARYLELLVNASDAESIRHALGARFLPSAYYPAMRWDSQGENARDYIVLSRSLAVLDFRGLDLQPAYADYLREYYKLWREFYIGKVLPDQ